MNKTLLLQVRDRILAEPRQFLMERYFKESGPYFRTKGIPNCGTAACIAGWAVAIAKQITPAIAHADEDNFNIDRQAGDLLGLDKKDYARLFFVSQWPNDLRVPFWNAEEEDNTDECARIAAQVIDQFIAEYESRPPMSATPT